MLVILGSWRLRQEHCSLEASLDPAWLKRTSTEQTVLFAISPEFLFLLHLCYVWQQLYSGKVQAVQCEVRKQGKPLGSSSWVTGTLMLWGYSLLHSLLSRAVCKCFDDTEVCNWLLPSIMLLIRFSVWNRNAKVAMVSNCPSPPPPKQLFKQYKVLPSNVWLGSIFCIGLGYSFHCETQVTLCRLLRVRVFIIYGQLY